MRPVDHRVVLDQRLRPRPPVPLEVRSRLRHFALITYAVPRERLARHLPTDRFDIPEFTVGGNRRALLSAVPFVDVDFHFVRLPFVKQTFAQTNHRAYVIDRKTGEHAVWFFGTTLGSPIVHLPRWLWRIPWHRAAYQLDCRFNPQTRRYASFGFAIDSKWCAAQIQVEDSGEETGALEGFQSLDEMKLVLTHPIDGFFHRTDGRLGSYSVWHEEMRMTQARARNLYFSLYETLGLLSREEMQHPHSILLCPEIGFRDFLPPRRAG